MALFEPSTTNLILSYFLPFLIIFMILYALLQKSKIFGDSISVKRLNAFLSAIVAVLVVGVNPFGITWFQFFTNLFGGSIVIIIAVAFFAVFVLMVGAAKGEKKAGWLSLIVGTILAYVALNISGIGQNLIPNLNGQSLDISQFIPYILVASIFAVLYGIWYMLGRESKTS